MLYTNLHAFADAEPQAILNHCYSVYDSQLLYIATDHTSVEACKCMYTIVGIAIYSHLSREYYSWDGECES